MIVGNSVEQNRIEKPLETTLPPIIIGIGPLLINSEFQKPSIFCGVILRSFHCYDSDSFGISPLLRLKRQIRMSIVPSIFGGRSSVYDPFSFDIWDPFSSLISDFGPSRQLAQDASAVANTRIDWKETPEAHLFKADLPGLKKEEVKVEVEEGRILKISGERSKEEEQKTDKWHRVERSHGRFQRRFRLPENVKVDELRASLENGVLTVTVPKQPEPKPKPEVKSIEIGGSG